MTTVKEIQIQSIGEPCQIRIERGQKGGYGYEINIHGETIQDTLEDVLEARAKLEKELYAIGGSQ